MKKHNWIKEDCFCPCHEGGAEQKQQCYCKEDKCENKQVIDIFGFSSGFHNGPRCSDCGYAFCDLCDPDGYDTECGTAETLSRPSHDDAKLDPTMVALDASIRKTTK